MSGHAQVVQHDLRIGRRADGQRVGEVAAVAVEHDRVVENEQVAALQDVIGRQSARFDILRRRRPEVAVDQSRPTGRQQDDLLDLARRRPAR